MHSSRWAYLLLGAAVVGLVVTPNTLVLAGASAPGTRGALELHLLAPLPAALRPLANGPVDGAAVIDGRLWVAFESPSAHPTRGSCIGVTACSAPLPPPTHGLVAILSASTGRLIRTITTGTNPRLAAADGHVWIGTMRSLPYDGDVSPQMPRVPAIGGGWVREYDARSGHLLRSYKVAFPTDIVAIGKTAYVFSLSPKHPYEGGSVLELRGGHARTIAGMIVGVAYGPMAVCNHRLAIAATIPSRATPDSGTGSAGAFLTFVSLMSGRERTDPIPPTGSWTTCAGGETALVPIPRTRPVRIYNDAWPPREATSLPSGETRAAASSARALWLILSKGSSLNSPNVVERYESGRWSEVPVHPALGSLTVDYWSLTEGSHELLFLSGGNVYSLTGTALGNRSAP